MSGNPHCEKKECLLHPNCDIVHWQRCAGVGLDPRRPYQQLKADKVREFVLPRTANKQVWAVTIGIDSTQFMFAIGEVPRSLNNTFSIEMSGFTKVEKIVDNGTSIQIFYEDGMDTLIRPGSNTPVFVTSGIPLNGGLCYAEEEQYF